MSRSSSAFFRLIRIRKDWNCVFTQRAVTLAAYLMCCHTVCGLGGSNLNESTPTRSTTEATMSREVSMCTIDLSSCSRMPEVKSALFCTVLGTSAFSRPSLSSRLERLS